MRRDGKLPLAWRRLLVSRRRPRSHDPGVLGFFLELMPEEGPPAAHAGHGAGTAGSARARPLRAAPVPLDSRHLRTPRCRARAAAGRDRARLAADVRKGRSYARLGRPCRRRPADRNPRYRAVLPRRPGRVCGCRAASRDQLNWHWQHGAGWQPAAVADPAAPTTPAAHRRLWYLDAERAELGLLEAAPEEIALAGRCRRWHEYGRKRCARACRTAGWPRGYRRRRCSREVRRAELAPQPVLTLHALTRHARLAAGTPPLGYARLAFDYAGERLPGRGGEPLVRRVRDGQLVEIVRRRAEELAAMEQLERAGLTPGVDTEGLPWDVADTLPDDAWLFPGTGYAGALEVNTPARWLALARKLGSGKFPGRIRAELSVRGTGRPGALVRQGGGRQRRSRVRSGNRHRGRWPAPQPAARRGAGAGRAPVESQPGAERARRCGVVCAGRCAPARAGAAEGIARPAGAAGRISGKPREKLHLPRVQAGRLEELVAAMPGGSRLEAAEPLLGFTARLRDAAAHASDAVPRRTHGGAAAVPARGPALVERAGRSRRRRRARRRHGPGQDPATDHPSAVAETGRRADPAGADRGADQPDPELAGRGRALRADAERTDPARPAARRGSSPSSARRTSC